MEIKIPREVRKYKETIFFGLSMRQFFCSAIAVGIAVLAYFALRETLGNEGVSWICILVALPIALIGFVTYHEMTLEHFIMVWIKSEWLMPKRLYFKSDNYMYTAYEKLKVDKKQQQKTQKRIETIERLKNGVKKIQAMIVKYFALAKRYIQNRINWRKK